MEAEAFKGTLQNGKFTACAKPIDDLIRPLEFYYR
jgi:hypothetical protein